MPPGEAGEERRMIQGRYEGTLYPITELKPGHFVEEENLRELIENALTEILNELNDSGIEADEFNEFAADLHGDVGYEA